MKFDITKIKTYFVAYLLIGLLTVGILFCLLKYLHIDKDKLATLISGTRDIFQIIFFTVVMTVTVLSYLQAKKTLFTPIKTETFKIQIKSFEEILSFFQNKSETDLVKLFDLDEIIKLNGSLLFYRYIDAFFKNEVEINKERFIEIKKKSRGAIVNHEFAMKHFIKADLYKDKNKNDNDGDIINPALILNKWKEDKVGVVELTEKYQDAVEKLNNLIASPLIPKNLKSILSEFEEVVSTNIYRIIDVLDEISFTIPNKFPTKGSLDKFELSGIWNQYNEVKKPLEPKAKEILVYITDYLKIEELTK